MYHQHFGLDKDPFSTSPDPRFYFSTAKHREALACLMYTVEQSKGFAMITGEVGTGKTMLCRAALDRMDANVDVATVSHPSLNSRQFLQAVCMQFDLETELASSGRDRKTKVELLTTLREFLVKNKQRDNISVLIVDEAQGLSRKLLEEIRLLGNLETGDGKLLNIILVGQPELRDIMRKREMRHLEQRIVLKFHLAELSRNETETYIDHRLSVAGCNGQDVFTDEAKFVVYQASNGIPRLINVLCDHCLLRAFVEDRGEVDGDIVERVVTEKEGFYMDREPEPRHVEHVPGQGAVGPVPDAQDSKRTWYVRIEGRRRGPYTRDEMATMVSQRTIDALNLVRTRDEAHWRRLGEVPQFRRIVRDVERKRAAEKDRDSLRSSSWYVAVSGGTQGPFSFEKMVEMAENGELKPHTRVYPVGVKAGWRRVAEFDVFSKSVRNRGRWYIAEHGESYGPYRAEEIEEMVRRGRLKAGAPLWRRGWDEWRLLKNQERFARLLQDPRVSACAS